MKKIILKNRFTLLTTIMLAYVLLLVIEGMVTSREPALLRFDNSLFELNLEELNEISNRFM
jgi:uncharacterized protein YjeT (DUF2065 family)